MVLIVQDTEIKKLLPMKDCMEAVEVAFKEYAHGEAANPPRSRYACSMPGQEMHYRANVHIGAVPGYGVAAVRLGSSIDYPVGRERVAAGFKRIGSAQPGQRHWGIVLLYSLETAELLAVIHDFTISSMRVAKAQQYSHTVRIFSGR